MKKLSIIFSCGFGIGLIPFAPGTFGSLLGILLGLFLAKFSITTFLISLIILFFIFSLMAKIAGQHWNEIDCGKIVSDEILGQAIPFILLINSETNLMFFSLLAFILFRVFDILKPFPINKIDQIKNSFTVMLDDVVAGIFACIMLLLINKFYLFF